jgi:hypothetical protein
LDLNRDEFLQLSFLVYQGQYLVNEVTTSLAPLWKAELLSPTLAEDSNVFSGMSHAH